MLSRVKSKLFFFFNICFACFPTTEGKNHYLTSTLIENAVQGMDFKTQLFFWREEKLI